MTISALFAALLLFVSASADPNSSEPIIDNASAGASDDQIAALPPVLALSDSETVTSAETLLECIINNAEYDLELASSMARVSRACPELIERRLAELWRRELRCPSSDLDLVRTLETILTQSERQFDRESFLVEIFDDDIAALVLRRLVFVATLLPNTIASLIVAIGRIPSVHRLLACWVVLFYETSVSWNLLPNVVLIEICCEILEATEAPLDSGLLEAIPDNIRETVNNSKGCGAPNGLRQLLPEPFSQIICLDLVRGEITDLVRGEITERHQQQVRELRTLAPALFFFGTPLDLNLFELDQFTDDELRPALPYVVGAPEALSAQIDVLIKQQRYDLIRAIIQSESFRTGDRKCVADPHIHRIILALIDVGSQHDLLRTLLQTPFENDLLAKALRYKSPDGALHRAVRVGNVDAVRELLSHSAVLSTIDGLNEANRTARSYALEDSEIARLLDEAPNRLDAEPEKPIVKTDNFEDVLDQITKSLEEVADDIYPEDTLLIAKLLQEVKARRSLGLDDNWTARMLKKAPERIVEAVLKLKEAELDEAPH